MPVSVPFPEVATPCNEVDTGQWANTALLKEKEWLAATMLLGSKMHSGSDILMS